MVKECGINVGFNSNFGAFRLLTESRSTQPTNYTVG